ncbi:MAG: YbgC/FadM family acyl-CoA thioesterase [Candidatus Omnitrophica bacterium]|nr:YbgC/FadM family acyl-CoA thioesterase [Candidatus Omnitrophota bacterium]
MKKHTTRHRVTYKETDQMGVVYYANYLVWFEIARTEYFREKGLVYKTLEDERRIYLPVAEAGCRYKAPSRYDDIVSISTWISEKGSSRMTFSYEVDVSGKVIATGFTKHAFINSSGKPIPIPDDIRYILE